MKGKTAKLLAVFFSSVLLALLLTYTAEGADAILGFNEKAQEHSEWCWAGSSQSVLEYYGTVLDQCTIANFASGKTTCCTPSGFYDYDTDINYCNYWNYMWGASPWNVPNGGLQGILAHWGVANTPVSSYLSWNTCVSEINAERPFVMRFGWTSGGGHFLDGFGYDTSSQHLYYMDPWPGNGYTMSLYSWVVSASDHGWTHTLQITTNPAACTNFRTYTYDNSTYSWGAGAPSIQAAYDDANTADGYTIFARALGTIEQVSLNRNIAVNLNGGLDCNYDLVAGMTRISGSLTVQSGSVTVSNLVIQP